MTRRKYGHGSLHQRRDLRWIGRLPDGRGGHRYFTGTDRDDVRRRMDEARRLRDRTTSVTRRGGERVRDVIARYQATIDPLRSRPKTLATNAMAARDHINPAVGSLWVRQLELADVQRMVDRMTATGLSPKTVRNTVSVLRTILTQAMREGVVDRNVATLAVLPPSRRERLPSLTTDELRRFLEATRGTPMWPVWVMLSTTGMRASELLGLRWKDVGTEAPPRSRSDEGAPNAQSRSTVGRQSSAGLPGEYTTVTIDGTYRTVVERDADGRPTATVFVRMPTKTPRSRRTVHLPRLAREAIAVQRKAASSAVVVFARANGNGPMNTAMVNRAFHAALTACGLPSVRLHSLRASAIVAVLDRTAGDLRVAQQMAGHSSIQTTVDVYGSNADLARQRAAKAMDEAMEGVG